MSVMLTHAELAERLNLPLSTVVSMRKREGWPHHRFGKHVRFDEEQVAEIIASHAVLKAPSEHPIFPGVRLSRPKSPRRD